MGLLKVTREDAQRLKATLGRERRRSNLPREAPREPIGLTTPTNLSWIRVQNYSGEIIPAHGLMAGYTGSNTTAFPGTVINGMPGMYAYKLTADVMSYQGTIGGRCPVVLVNGSADIPIGGTGVATLDGPTPVLIPQPIANMAALTSVTFRQVRLVPTENQWYASLLSPTLTTLGYLAAPLRPDMFQFAGTIKTIDAMDGKYAAWCNRWPREVFYGTTVAQINTATVGDVNVAPNLGRWRVTNNHLANIGAGKGVMFTWVDSTWMFLSAQP